MLSRACRPAHRPDERGSVALAVTVIVILAGLTAVMLTRDSEELRHARTSQDRAIVLGALDEAIAAGTTRAAVDSADFDLSGSSGDVTWSVQAVRIGPDGWELAATAKLRSVNRAASVRLVRSDGSDWHAEGWHEIAPG